MTDARPGFDRAGHATELTLNRLRGDDPRRDPAFFEAVLAHLSDCASCRARLAAQDGADRDFALPVSPALAARWRHRPRARWWPRVAMAAATCALAASAVLFVVTRSPEDDSDLRGKGGLHVEVHVHDGRRSRPVGTGDVIHAGDRAVVAIRPDADGHLLALGWDATGVTYRIWPPAPDATEPSRDEWSSAPVPRSEATVQLPGAIRFDAAPGDEHLAVMFCEEPFDLAALPPLDRLSPAAPPPGCQLHVVVLHKRP